MRILTLFIFLCSLPFTGAMEKDDQFYFVVHFQDYFEDDNTAFTINDCNIFCEESLTSDKSTGVTRMRMNVKQSEGDLVVYNKDNLMMQCKNQDNGDIKLLVILNGYKNYFTVDLKQGKYLGFDKISENKVLLHQSNRRFFYD